MKRATVLITAAAAAVIALPVLASAAPPTPAAAAGPVLTGVSLSTGAVSVHGLDTVTVTVTVKATGEGGQCSGYGIVGAVVLQRTSPQKWDRSAPGSLVGPMACVSDSGGERTYRAVVPVPSTAHGPWRVAIVDFANSYHLDPRTFGLPDATLTVTGTHRPRLRISVRPQPLPYPERQVRVVVQATYDDTRTPVSTRWIGVTDDFGMVSGCGRCAGNTDTQGRVVRRLTLGDFREVIAFMPLTAPSAYDWQPMYARLSVTVVVQPVLVAAPAKGSVPKGTNVTVNGRADAVAVHRWPSDPRVRVYLQRLVGRHWRTVNEGTIRPNGRFTLVATPPAGRHLYRVTMPPQQDFGSARSGTFTIRGT